MYKHGLVVGLGGNENPDPLRIGIPLPFATQTRGDPNLPPLVLTTHSTDKKIKKSHVNLVNPCSLVL